MLKNVETFIGCDNEYEESPIVIFGAPYDSTTSYRPGTRFASKTMRSESYGLETYSPYLDLDLEDFKIFDSGDLELSFGRVDSALLDIYNHTKQILEANKYPLMIGGEHLVTLGVIRAMAEKYKDLHIIHFDAHADLRDDYLGAKLSHATVMRRCWDILGDGRIFQFGIRSGCKEEFQWGKDHIFTQKFGFAGLEDVINKIGNKPVYLTVDLDVLDCGIFPGTGTPEAGGVSFEGLRRSMEIIADNCNLVGSDLVELSPPLDTTGSSTAIALKLLREHLLSLSYNIEKK